MALAVVTLLSLSKETEYTLFLIVYDSGLVVASFIGGYAMHVRK